jgi:hypothetical protein
MGSSAKVKECLPRRIEVRRAIASRYGTMKEKTPGMTRPADWDHRKPGIDLIETTSGERIHLRSDGGQSVPKSGWIVMLTSGDDATGYGWTLYGMSRSLAQ